MKTHVKFFLAGFFIPSMAVIIGLCGHLYECSISRGLKDVMGVGGSVHTCGSMRLQRFNYRSSM